ncbi:MAG: DUF1939 domain-containing protein [Planctomycetes bacterium]|nr:DUF1939 domain-containing protein [Planctomycetota bacterium]
MSLASPSKPPAGRRPALPRAMLVATLLVFVLPAAGLRADDDIMLQGFWWDCPGNGVWYDNLRQKAPAFKQAGFSAIWLPPASKGAAGKDSMGYDVYDYYDLGNYNQKGTVATRFGTLGKLRALVQALHKNGMKAYADIVLNHVMGGELEDNPITGGKTWTKYVFPHHQFEKDWRFFHPNEVHRDNNGPYHDKPFGEDLCQAYGPCADGLKKWGDWLTSKVGYDGYRLDFVKGVDPGFIRDWLAYGRMSGRFCVSEMWDSNLGTLDWFVGETGGRSSVFDFNLFYVLKEMCNDGGGGFDMRRLHAAGYVAKNAFRAVTFCDNHDTDRSDPIMRDKLMAYAFILTMEGYPCVFLKDYEVYGMKPQIDTLMAIRKRLCGGNTTDLYSDGDLFIAQRNGAGKLPGCVLVLNDNPSAWKGAWVTTKWPGKDLKDLTGQAQTKHVADDGRVELWAPPRGYAVYGPDTPLIDPKAGAPGAGGTGGATGGPGILNGLDRGRR